MNRYELYAVNLDPTIGAEIKKTRPCVIISPDEMNKYLQTVQVAPLTSQERKIPSRVKIEATSTSGLKNDSFAALDQLKTIDKQRCSTYIGRISETEAMTIADVLCKMYQY
ncbi:type II toxin-antitoxin system PemK/MazF family toxin [Parabacteroides distasonis]|uniref:type II toxin-antitoxin system PemK/MazF family toxin n=1 Tax=Parabacteroides distasonis TaxID=823 RepID=UPI00189F5A81|nr:type II toxin-antitoxin system PemK/MazF family toxin [Parabacteroides distasonis]MDB9152328.1 type II toxin-antitoxin system PemK/MazF family toxin [Parabacteroides distasonis]MDB9156884.1 type II toxin-antitoxin system PemK/MazF family toxin [Parabacteroides distasonis]MDB9165584.1 type II toxin-antitoxin system PemK/MazF family toxin [Parabacteroides distasonis]MDB9170416.1 type II toxin-antitoxin system PemK/MazF family toxin [Parabacteroides distasonis]MDB9193308.1 type II toxin-antito